MAASMPVRCFTCGATVAHNYDEFLKLRNLYLKKYPPTDRFTEEYNHNADAYALDKMKVRRMCCRRMYISHIDFIDDLLMYPPMPTDGIIPDVDFTVGEEEGEEEEGEEES